MDKKYTAQYVLTFDEVKEALIAAGRLKPYFKTSLTQTVVAVIAMVMFGYGIISNPTNLFYYFIIAVCAVIIAYVWIYPPLNERRSIEQAVNGQTIDLTVESGSISVRRQDSGDGFLVPLDSRCRLCTANNLFVIELPDGRLLIVPHRAFDGGQVAEVLAVINDGIHRNTSDNSDKKGENQ